MEGEGRREGGLNRHIRHRGGLTPTLEIQDKSLKMESSESLELLMVHAIFCRFFEGF